MVDLPIAPRVLPAALVLALSLPGAHAQDVAPTMPESSVAVRADIVAFLKAHNRAAATQSALLLAWMGGSLSDDAFNTIADQLDPVVLAADKAPQMAAGPDRVANLRRWYHVNAAPVPRQGPFEQLATVPAEYRIVEGIAYDAATDRLFVSSVADGRLAYLHQGQWHEVSLGFPRSGLFGMAVDLRRRRLWIASAPVDESALRDKPLAGLIALDLDRLQVVERLAVTGEPGVPGDVAVGEDGTVYVSNSQTGAIQMHRPGSDGLTDLVRAGRFASPQGMALSRDGKRLYFADYGSGLWIVRLSDGEVTRLRAPLPTMLDGIDGLVRVPGKDTLVAIQNGSIPRRIIRIHLTADGEGIGSFEVRAVLPEDAPDPDLGTLRDGRLWFVGDGQWERYGPGGVIKDGQPPRPTPVLIDRAD